MNLRDYQVACLQACCQAVDDGKRRLLAVLPTGMGKTVIFCKLADFWVQQSMGRVLLVCPLIELVYQTAEKLEQWTDGHIDIEQGANWADETIYGKSPFVVASKQTLLSGDRYRRFEGVTLVVVDEAHLSITAKMAAMVDWFADQGAAVLGVTATPKRHDKKALANIYHDAVFTVGIAEAIDDGWLVGCETHCVELEKLDLTSVKTAGGDFVQSALGEVMEDEKVCYEIAAVTAKEMERG